MQTIKVGKPCPEIAWGMYFIANVGSCHIGLVGLKWLCKANMEKLKSLDISDN